jgi:formiminoglutamase
MYSLEKIPLEMNPPSPDVFFKGRPGDPRLGDWAEPSNMLDHSTQSKNVFALIGAPDDTGVRLNRGRPGARFGPDAIREALYKFAWPLSHRFDAYKLRDFGNIDVSEDITKNHQMAFSASAAASTQCSTVIALGGGHDFAAPHVLGTFSVLKQVKKTARFGVINIDPHLDVREFENGRPHSGTPFRQILESGSVRGEHLIQFGARDGRNARSHFDYCKTKKVKIFEFSSLKQKANLLNTFQSCLLNLTEHTDHVAVTIDLDSCAEIDGVSAAPVIGFSPWELCQFAFHAGKSSKVRLLELAELAPNLDPSGRSARIAAEIAFHFILGRIG